MLKLRVVLTQTRSVSIFRHQLNPKTGKFEKTKEVQETKLISREQVLFQGSDEAYKIWRANHYQPLEARVERVTPQEFSGYYKPMPSVIFPRE